MASLRDVAARVSDALRRYPWLIVVGVVLSANAIYLLGLADPNPMAWTGGPRIITSCLRACNTPSLDPNAGFITAAAGHESAMLWLHGHLPWWDYYQGVGAPLAGGLQAASFSPFTLLLAFPSGLMWVHVIYELIGGVATYFVMRRVTPSVTGAVVAGSLFALNGTFAWIGNAAVNPTCFIPLLILGVEHVCERVRGERRYGWRLFALALALSLLGGFPEVTYLSLFLVAAWAFVRMGSVTWVQRRHLIRLLAGASVTGLALASPVLVAFVDYLPHAYSGWHGSGAASSPTLPGSALALLGVPYNLGGLWQLSTATPFWGQAGGFISLTSIFLAAFAFRRSAARPLAVMLAGVSVVFLLGSFGVAPFHQLMDLVPGMTKTAYSRYSPAIWEFAVSVLAGCGIAALQITRRRVMALVVGALLLLWVAGNWWHYRAHLMSATTPLGHSWDAYRLAIMGFVIASALLLCWQHRAAVIRLVSIVAIAEAAILFAIPMTGAASSSVNDDATVSFLQEHLGTSRFATLHPLFPNWGSYFSLGSIEVINLPLPKDFVTYSATHLNTMAPQPQQILPPTDGAAGTGTTTDFQNMLATLLPHYEHAAVKYLLLPASMPLAPSLVHAGLTLVQPGTYASIYQLPHPQRLFSASASCVVVSQQRDSATVHCEHRGTLLRREEFMAGWTATAAGRTLPISRVEGLYQSVSLSEGTQTVSFSFLPPHEKFAAPLVAGALGALTVGAWGPVLTRSSRGRGRFARRRRREAPNGAAAFE